MDSTAPTKITNADARYAALRIAGIQALGGRKVAVASVAARLARLRGAMSIGQGTTRARSVESQVTAMPDTWICEDCAYESVPTAALCQRCMRPRFSSFAIMVASHVLELIADGYGEPLPILEALQARPCYTDANLSLAFIAQQMRLLTKDTTTLARQIAKARSARTMIEALEQGSIAEKIRVMEKWGPETNAEHVDHKGEVSTTVTHVYEQLPPKL